LEFSNQEVAETIYRFARAVKEITDYEQTVGVFYGYTMEVCNGLFGNLAIGHLIDKNEIDFFCSPNSYVGTRSLGIDWGDMIATGSVKSHGKLCFLECDIRTSLSDYVNNCRPGADKNNMYYGDIWLGPKTIKNSVNAMRKSFAHQYTKGSGMWWFDMWGGWYDHTAYRKEAKNALSLYSKRNQKYVEFSPQLAVFADGNAYIHQCIGTRSHRSQFEIRNAVGNSGVPYESYLLQDFETQYKNYKAIIFPSVIMTEDLQKAVSICEKEHIPYLLATEEKWNFTAEEIRAFAKSAGAWIFCESDDVIYCGNGFLGVHTVCEGETKVVLPHKMKIRPFGTTQEGETEAEFITFTAPKHTTKLFELL
jgi:beta-galactosidase